MIQAYVPMRQEYTGLVQKIHRLQDNIFALQDAFVTYSDSKKREEIAQDILNAQEVLECLRNEVPSCQYCGVMINETTTECLACYSKILNGADVGVLKRTNGEYVSEKDFMNEQEQNAANIN